MLFSVNIQDNIKDLTSTKNTFHNIFVDVN